MSFQLDRGLFQFDFTDHHAILGVGVNAEEIKIRERYQTVARALHPDSAQWKTDAERQLAVKLFSRLVTHAYGKLSRASQLQEQVIMLELLGKRSIEQGDRLQINDPLCQQLYQSGNDFELVYDRLLAEMAQRQYTVLTESEQIVNQMSELNMVYLLRRQLQSVRSTPPPSAATGSLSGEVNGNKSSDLGKVSPIEGALRRATDYMSSKNWAKAVPELREAIGAEPNNARAHALLGLVYLNQQQLTMSKLSIDKAMRLNPQDPQAIQAKQEFDRASNPSRNNSTSKTAIKPKVGMFGGLFDKK
jgi:tetratricopeptide (TPR) repeat protein